MKYAVILTYRGFDPDVDDIARKLGRRFGVRDVGSGFDGATRDIEFGAFGSKTRAVEFVKDARRLNFHARIREDAHNNPPLTRVKQVGPNMTEIRHGEITALYSYETPVALDTPSGLYRTATHFSNTTAKHISKWGAKTAPKISQEKIELAIQRGVDPQTLGAERGPHRNPGDVHIDIDSHKRNPHMERQVFQNDGWVIETEAGDFASPDFDASDVDDLRATIGTSQKVMLGDSIYGRVENVTYLPKKTWWGRLSAPGYLDATDYVYGKTEKEVEQQLDDLYGEEEEEDEEE